MRTFSVVGGLLSTFSRLLACGPCAPVLDALRRCGPCSPYTIPGDIFSGALVLDIFAA
jgi:hypothetical protein